MLRSKMLRFPILAILPSQSLFGEETRQGAPLES